MAVLPFSLLAAQRCPALDEIALALAHEFHRVDAGVALARLDDLGAQLAEHRCGRPLREARACGDVLATGAGLRACTGVEPEHLFLDTILEHGIGHPLVLAIIYAEVGRRAGIALCPVGAPHACLIAHAHADEPLVLDPRNAGTVVPPAELPPGLRWLCPHEATFAILGELVGAYALTGDLRRARHAAQLRLALPLADALRQRVKLEIKGLDAHLN